MGLKKKYLFSPKLGFVYVRVKGKYLGRLTASEGTEEFDRQYWEILNGRAAIKTTWEALIDSYKRSSRWTRLASKTKVYYDHVIIYMLQHNGKRDVRRLERRHVIAAMEANKARARFAASIPSVLSVLCEHAIDIGWIKENPAKGVRKLEIPKDRKRPHLPWTDEAVAKWRQNTSGRALLAFEIGIGTAQRPGDLVNFRWADYDGENLSLQQSKTGVSLRLPCTPELKAALDAAKADLGGSPHPSRFILTDQSGAQLTYSALNQMMRKIRKRLGLMQHDLHAMRYRGIQELAWKGCSDEEIASFSGHTTMAMIRKYAGEARQVMRARQAAEKRK